MKYADIVAQTLFMLAGVTLVATITITGTATEDSNWRLALLFIQFLLGAWQFLSSLISVATRAEFQRPKSRHLIISIAYLVILILTTHQELLSKDWLFAFVTIPAWTLAVYYYIITWCWVLKKNNKRGSFLSNLSF